MLLPVVKAKRVLVAIVVQIIGDASGAYPDVAQGNYDEHTGNEQQPQEQGNGEKGGCVGHISAFPGHSLTRCQYDSNQGF